MLRPGSGEGVRVPPVTNDHWGQELLDGYMAQPNMGCGVPGGEGVGFLLELPRKSDFLEQFKQTRLVAHIEKEMRNFLFTGASFNFTA